MMSPLDITIFALCIIVYISLISYCSYYFRTKNEVKTSDDYVEV